MWLSGLGVILQSVRSQVGFRVQARAWVAGSVPGPGERGAYERQTIDVSLWHRCFCLSPLSLLLSLKIDK